MKKINDLITYAGMVLVFILMVFACKHDPDEFTPVDPPGPDPADSCDSVNVSFNQSVIPILQEYCYGCHSQPNPSGGLDLTNYQILELTALNGSLVGSVTHTGGFSPMPKNGVQLSECQIAVIRKWVSDTIFSGCDSSNVTYPGTVYPILAANCTSCHSGPSPAAGYDFTSYTDVTASVLNGSFLGAITHTPGYSAMPKDQAQLTNCSIALISKWINDTIFPEPPPVGIPCDPDTFYFQNEILPLLQSSCAMTGCHDPGSAQEGVILNSYLNVINTGEVEPFSPLSSKLYEVLIEDEPEDRMPPPPRSLTTQQKQSIYGWIAQGALNNYCEDLDCDSINVTFSQTVWPVIQTRCYGCHSGTNPSGGISLANYNNVKTAGAKPAGTYGSLLGTIMWYGGNVPMPKNGNQLSDCNIAQIKKWIEDGMPDN